MRTFDSIIRTTSNLFPSLTFDRIVAVQLFSSMTLVVGKRKADELAYLFGASAVVKEYVAGKRNVAERGSII